MNLYDNIIYTDFSFAKSLFRQRFDQISWFIKHYFGLKKENFDECIFLDHSRFFAKAIPLLKIKNLIGPSTWWCGNNIKNPNINSLTHIVELPADSDSIHMSERYQTIIRNYLNSSDIALPFLPKTMPQTEKKVFKLLNRKNKKGIVLSLQGDNIAGNNRAYSIEYTVEIIQNLSKLYDLDFYIIGTKSCSNNADIIMSKVYGANITNLCGKTDLLELKSVLEQNDLLISVDTGTIHIAATTEINIIGIYGPNKPENSMPVSSKAKILYTAESCSPCHYRRTVLGKSCQYADNPICLSHITPNMVIEAAKRILEEIKK